MGRSSGEVKWARQWCVKGVDFLGLKPRGIAPMRGLDKKGLDQLRASIGRGSSIS